MTDALGDFFKKKKKTAKAVNLNTTTSTVAETTSNKQANKKDQDEEGWEEEQVVAATMKVEVAGKLTREEDKKDEEDNVVCRWKNNQKGDSKSRDLNEKKYPSLAASIKNSSNINIDDGSDQKINIKTSKNNFSALANSDDEDEDQKHKRPKEIKPAMVQKKKGERETVAIQREVDKYVPTGPAAAVVPKKKEKKKAKAIEEDEEEDEEEEDDDEEKKADKKRKKAEPAVKAAAEEQADEAELAEDLKIEPDLVAQKAKYEGRKRLPPVELRRSELQEEKKKVQETVNPGKKKKAFKGLEDDDKKAKLLIADWD